MSKKRPHRSGVSGDPRKRARPDELKAPLPSGRTIAQAFTHVCGCRLAWSCKHDPSEPQGSVIGRLQEWLRGIAHLPCPMHGSASGVASEPLLPGQMRILAADRDVAYTLCPEAYYADADAAGQALRAEASSRRQKALAGVMKADPGQAAQAERVRHLAGGSDEACFVCGDTKDTDWWRWTDSVHEGLLCPDCVKIQQRLHSEGEGDHLVRVVRP